MSTLFEREHFEAHVAALPHSFIVHQWGDASVGKVGPQATGKIFAILSNWSRPDPAIAFKCSDMSFKVLCELEDIRPAPYLARAKWVQVGHDSPLQEEDLKAYIAQAHTMIWEKLSLAQRRMLDTGRALS